MIALDASVLIAYLDAHNAHHARAIQILAGAGPGELLVHSLNLAEVLVGAVPTGQESAMARTVEEVGIRVSPRVADEPMALARLRATSGRKLPDCCAMLVAQTSAAALATFDEALARSAAKLGIPLQPSVTEQQPAEEANLDG
ncbi:MAG: type II toxin-antitoxin system VapC family toxin [Bifidobacteriaceae bacterium]|nr:type II toxin-antitoxin system VapC family toxin [Bifidobacteriaceae bacterium]